MNPWLSYLAGFIDGAALLFLGLFLAGAFDHWTYRTLAQPSRLRAPHSPRT